MSEEDPRTEMEKAFLAANDRRQRQSTTTKVASYTVSAEAPTTTEVKQEEPVKKKLGIFGK